MVNRRLLSLAVIIEWAATREFPKDSPCYRLLLTTDHNGNPIQNDTEEGGVEADSSKVKT